MAKPAVAIEYKIFTIDRADSSDAPNFQDQLNEWGREGWDLQYLNRNNEDVWGWMKRHLDATPVHKDLPKG